MMLRLPAEEEVEGKKVSGGSGRETAEDESLLLRAALAAVCLPETNFALWFLHRRRRESDCVCE